MKRFSAGTRRIVLLTHIISAAVWLGLDVAMAVLVFTATGTDDANTRSFALQALQLVTVWPMVTAGLLSLISGILLGLGTKYGLVRYRWVFIKLVINIVLCVLVLFLLRGGVAEAASAGRAGEVVPRDIVFPPIVSTSALLFAYWLSLYKPWGRFRKTSRASVTTTLQSVEISHNVSA